MIVVASLVCNIIVDGVCFSYGIFYVEFLEYFGESKAKTAWVGSLVPGLYLGMGECFEHQTFRKTFAAITNYVVKYYSVTL